ncbi:MAG TPA: hypothetical protein VKT80_18525 [Chloroflexota bacterium]|nr:hypothetical protein [Chloroflexota bacterium]
MTPEPDNRLPPTTEAALDNLLSEWVGTRNLTPAQADALYRAILRPSQDLSGQWFLDLMRQINQTLSRVVWPSASLVAFQDLATAESSLAGLREARRSPKLRSTYRPYLRLTPQRSPA